jgi:hypothetical protein
MNDGVLVLLVALLDSRGFDDIPTGFHHIAADLGLLNPWLRNIRDVYRLHEKELDAIPEEHAR